ncbi:substrate-binding periplasmic protein [Algicola sagamiensis]|uniref:substrate-binding periplasmic protein n=1 Tax=Algicola sagamiensis TaxID=163869 RepID=UPI000375D340|nr:transporter substrate-binding domain-containing protein [Algicola sagamiensis]
MFLRSFIFLICFTTAYATASEFGLELAHDPYPPYVIEGADNQGLVCDIVQGIFADIGIPVQFHIIPWTRALEFARQGKYDGLISAWHSAERAQFVHFSYPYITNRVRLLYKKDKYSRVVNLKDITLSRIGTMRNYAYGPLLESVSNYYLIPAEKFESNIKLISNDRVDLVAEDEAVATYYLNQKMPGWQKNYRFSELIIVEKTMQLALSQKLKDHKEITERFNQQLLIWKKSGKLKALYEEHKIPASLIPEGIIPK